MEPDVYINKIKDINIKLALKILSDNFRANKARIIPVEHVLNTIPGNTGSRSLPHNIMSPMHLDTYQGAVPEAGSILQYSLQDGIFVWSPIVVGTTGQVLMLSTGGGGFPEAFWTTELLEVVVRKLQESSGPTNLTLGAIADGEFLKRTGATIVGAAAGGAENQSIISVMAL